MFFKKACSIYGLQYMLNILIDIGVSIYAERGTNQKQAERAVTGSDIGYETRKDLFEVTLPRRVSISRCSGTFMG